MITKITKKKYVKIYKPDHKYSQTKKGWIFAHRAVVEDYIKRALKSGEAIHHIDKNKQNNKIENLMIFQNNKEHMIWHAKMKQYGYLTNPMKRILETRWEKFK